MNLFKKLFKREKKKDLESHVIDTNENFDGMKELWNIAFKVSLDQGIEAVEKGEAENLDSLKAFFSAYKKEVKEEVEEESVSFAQLTEEQQDEIMSKIDARIEEIEEEDSKPKRYVYTNTSTVLKR